MCRRPTRTSLRASSARAGRCASPTRRSPASSSACSAGGNRMSFLSFLLGEKKKTASVAKERLQIILAHERSGRNPGGSPDYLPALQRDLVAVISKYVKIDAAHLKVNVERQDNLEVLDIKIELPEVAR